ncbi:non-ribosomal peptide synthetase [Bradyrhizobium sp. BR 10261]|uniref:non-ribosomal peptide synthetase n=1 Tax=Bradyrhizobium sp. BR 10261 TaxID=2749992 RepID=UPI001C64C0E3|nr:non-ribosomal peptide synthetase [Bradyrhizobium sp. BR 10261]MBW7967166.1 amino acid adenylation domain-containing protein [Bradyrhizobium sp. BR 10261]
MSIGEEMGSVSAVIEPVTAESDVPSGGYRIHWQGTPLSSAQERIWIVNEMYPPSGAYNITAAQILRGTVDTTSLRRAVERTVARHEGLRSRFAVVDGHPVQVVTPSEGPWPITMLDYRDHAGEEREHGLRETIDMLRTAPFDLIRDSLFRVAILQIDLNQTLLVLVIHHIVSDEWSMGLLFRDILEFYNSQVTGEPIRLPKLGSRYLDYTLSQQGAWLDTVMKRHLPYWRERLAEAPQRIELPTDRPHSRSPRMRGGGIPISISEVLGCEIKRLARRERATPFMVLLAVYQLVLARWSGQDDILVGVPVAGRSRRDLEDVVGCFVNMLVLRAEVPDRCGFAEHLRATRQTVLAALAHQDVPFEKLVQALQPPRGLSHHPFFQVTFVLQTAPSTLPDVEGVEVTPTTFASAFAKFELSLELREEGDGYAGVLEYSADLFDASTAARLVAHFETLLEAALADPERPVKELPLLTAGERRTLVEWNMTAAPYPAERCLHELFSEQVLRTPEAVAVVFGAERISYGDLETRANRLARHLRERGLGREAVVGLCLERSTALVVGLLAILKAGGAYLPLDPDYPADRLAYMLSDARAAVVLTHSTLAHRLPASSNISIMCVDSEAEAIGAQPNCAPAVPVHPDNLAYVIYTSGSTGRPKGVMEPHRGVVNRLTWMQDVYQLDSTDRVLQKTPFSFDVSVWEFFWPLLYGARLVVAPPGAHRDPLALSRLIGEQGITIVHFVPSMLRAFLDGADLAQCATLRDTMCSGEALQSDLQNRFLGALGSRLHNLYGPTEAAVDVSFWACRPLPDEALVPIGRPIANTQLHVLDRCLEPVPVGVAGELYIGGIGLARGYHGRPDLTADRFVPNPFNVGQRLYRTGDLARWRRDGELEFLGRTDQQVKIRGFRIEPSEVEAIMLSHVAVSQAVVDVREDGPGLERRLVAYLVLTGEQPSPSSADLREFARSRLPDYMVPSAFVVLPGLPLTPNGKLDRKALPPPDYRQEQFVVPATPLQAALARIWAEVLGIDRVGANDNFFDLGGHSLLATRLVAGIRKHTGCDIPIRSIFETKTLAEQAALIDEFKGWPQAALLMDIVPKRRPASVPATAGQLRLWYQAMGSETQQASLVDHVAENLSYVADLRGPLQVHQLEAALRRVVERHEALRTTFGCDRGQVVQIVGDAQLQVLEIVDARHMKGEAIDSALETACRKSFDLKHDRPLRALLLQVGDDHAVLAIVVHHVVSDGWSMQIILSELAEFYNAALDGRVLELQPALQFADYALWHQRLLRDGSLDEQIAYWKRTLAAPPPPLAVGADLDGADSLSQATRPEHRRIFPLSRPQRERATAVAKRVGCSPMAIYMTAVHLLIRARSGRSDVVVLVASANRRNASTQKTVGRFFNYLAIRTRSTPDMAAIDLLRHVNTALTEGYERQETPFELIHRALTGSDALFSRPISEVAMNFMTADAPLMLRDVKAHRRADPGISNLKRALNLGFVDDGLTTECQMRVDAMRFSASAADRLMTLWIEVLDALIRDPSVTVEALLSHETIGMAIVAGQQE